LFERDLFGKPVPTFQYLMSAFEVAKAVRRGILASLPP
jgi:hypothetical protein